MIALTSEPIDTAALRAAVSDPAFGAIVLFEGVTRDHFEGRRVVHLEYEAYEPLAVHVLQTIRTEIASQWPGVRFAIVHRIGVVPLGEASVVIGIGSPHRAAGYEANRYAIEQLKARVPIWKKEVYEDGSSWKANTASS